MLRRCSILSSLSSELQCRGLHMPLDCAVRMGPAAHQRGPHLRDEVRRARAAVHDGDSDEVHLPDDRARLREGVIHAEVDERAQQRATVIECVQSQEK